MRTNARAYAKINLSLKICGVRADGMHELDMIVSAVDLYDEITICRTEAEEVSTRFFSGEDVAEKKSFENTEEGRQDYFTQGTANFPQSVNSIDLKKNTACKAAVLMKEAFGVSGGFDITIIKGIPVEAGFGGSSADAAGVIMGICALMNINPYTAGSSCIFNEKILALAAKCGSDVPCMLSHGFKRVRGCGERIESINSGLRIPLLLGMMKKGVSTPQSFKEWDRQNPKSVKIWKNSENRTAETEFMKGKDGAEQDTNSLLQKSLEAGLLENSYISNDLTAASVSLVPEIEETLLLLKTQNPLAVSMTGSGAACFAVFESFEKAKKAERLLKNKLLFCKAVQTI